MATSELNADYWSLTPPQLATQIYRMAYEGPLEFGAASRVETQLLAKEWREALSLPTDSFEQEEESRARLAALQRRSIEILVHNSRPH